MGAGRAPIWGGNIPGISNLDSPLPSPAPPAMAALRWDRWNQGEMGPNLRKPPGGALSASLGSRTKICLLGGHCVRKQLARCVLMSDRESLRT
jgi:hypothetical protein